MRCWSFCGPLRQERRLAVPGGRAQQGQATPAPPPNPVEQVLSRDERVPRDGNAKLGGDDPRRRRRARMRVLVDDPLGRREEPTSELREALRRPVPPPPWDLGGNRRTLQHDHPPAKRTRTAIHRSVDHPGGASARVTTATFTGRTLSRLIDAVHRRDGQRGPMGTGTVSRSTSSGQASHPLDGALTDFGEQYADRGARGR